MKNQSIFFAALMIFSMTACMEDGIFEDGMDDGSASGSSLFTTASYDASAETLISASFDDIDESTDEAIERYFSFAQGGGHHGRIEGPFGNHLECAAVTRDSVNQIITIDFGDGCEDPRGIIRSGKIIIEHGGEFRQPGEYRIVTFENFFIDSIGVEGVRTITNVSDTAANPNLIVHDSQLESGKLTFPDGTTITREANHTRSRYRGDTREESYATISGSASGTLQDGTDYNMQILEEIYIDGACQYGVPVKGIKEFIAGDQSVTIDFGDGSRDNLANLTINGETETIELQSRQFLDREHRGKRGRGKGGRHGG